MAPSARIHNLRKTTSYRRCRGGQFQGTRLGPRGRPAGQAAYPPRPSPAAAYAGRGWRGRWPWRERRAGECVSWGRGRWVEWGSLEWCQRRRAMAASRVGTGAQVLFDARLHKSAIFRRGSLSEKPEVGLHWRDVWRRCTREPGCRSESPLHRRGEGFQARRAGRKRICEPDSRLLSPDADGTDGASRKRTGIVTHTATGVPFCWAGEKRHERSAVRSRVLAKAVS